MGGQDLENAEDAEEFDGIDREVDAVGIRVSGETNPPLPLASTRHGCSEAHLNRRPNQTSQQL